MTLKLPLSQTGPADKFAQEVQAMPEQSVLLTLLRYEPETGKLFWKERGSEMFSDGHNSAVTCARRWNTKFGNKEAFKTVGRGYKQGCIFNKSYWAHRIIFKIVTGFEPIEVDHIDGDRANNRWDNLRAADHSLNMRNTFRREDNTSGVTGVNWHKAQRKWRSRITENGKHIYLGKFSCFGAAIKARKIAHAEHGYSPRHGTAR